MAYPGDRNLKKRLSAIHEGAKQRYVIVEEDGEERADEWGKREGVMVQKKEQGGGEKDRMY